MVNSVDETSSSGLKLFYIIRRKLHVGKEIGSLFSKQAKVLERINKLLNENWKSVNWYLE